MSAAIMSQDETGAANLVEYLLRACPKSLEAKNIGGLTPLAVVCWLGRLSLQDAHRPWRQPVDQGLELGQYWFEKIQKRTNLLGRRIITRPRSFEPATVSAAFRTTVQLGFRPPQTCTHYPLGKELLTI